MSLLYEVVDQADYDRFVRALVSGKNQVLIVDGSVVLMWCVSVSMSSQYTIPMLRSVMEVRIVSECYLALSDSLMCPFQAEYERSKNNPAGMMRGSSAASKAMS